MSLKVLVACEESQAVTKEFRRLGHEAYSCDLLPCSGGHPEWHLQENVLDWLDGFYRCSCGHIHPLNTGKYGCCGVSKINTWDLVISFQPCTDIAVSGAAWFEKKRESGEQEKSIRFFFEVWKKSNCSENPVGVINGGNYIRKWFPELYADMEAEGFPFKPTQFIEPYMFGDSANKKTCLWLKGLPELRPTDVVEGSKYITAPSGRKYPEWCWNTGKGCGTKRSKTFPGIAKAMAEQWAKYLEMVKPIE